MSDVWYTVALYRFSQWLCMDLVIVLFNPNPLASLLVIYPLSISSLTNEWSLV